MRPRATSASSRAVSGTASWSSRLPRCRDRRRLWRAPGPAAAPSPLAGGGFGQVAVLHLPGVVERVVGRVAEQVRDRPLAQRLALGVPAAHRLDEAVPVLGEPVRREEIV